MIPGFTALGSAYLFLLIPPLVVLYFLKLRRERLEVPSLVLWKQVLEDRRVNSPFQKFKKHLLLLLQLLLLMLLILAAMQPYVKGGGDDFEYIPIIIDHSASMGARDELGGKSRLDEAKGRVSDLANQLQSHQRVCLIAVADSARKLTDFTNNARVLQDVLDDLDVWEVESDIEDALRLTSALRQGTGFNRAILYSDGNFAEKSEISLAYELNYQQLEHTGRNAGITALRARRSEEEGEWEVFVGISGNDGKKMTGELVAMLDGKRLFDEKQYIAVKHDEEARTSFTVATDEAGLLEVKLAMDGYDAMVSDNWAAIRLEKPRKLRVFVSESLVDFERALGVMKDVELDVIGGSHAGEGGEYDLAVVDMSRGEEADGGISARVRMNVGGVPKELEEVLSVDQTGDGVVDWMGQSELLRHLELSVLMLTDHVTYSEGQNEKDLAALDYEVLMDGWHGPLMLRKRAEGRLRYEMLYHVDRSSLSFGPALPMMMYNLKQIAMHECGLLEQTGDQTGVLASVSGLGMEKMYTMKGPGGVRIGGKTNLDGELRGVKARKVGKYVLDGPARVMGASLLSKKETMLAAAQTIAFNEDQTAVAASAVEIDRPIWRWMAGIAMIFLLVEWWYYQRKPGGHASWRKPSRGMVR
ncbi:vWA domain-containing protein [Poriferisphaera sp. WC338]|uniref:vWA domain-containing protein n=1 Tax=Poriferisphaera sp. WC338 TaxID=3425129 RepID=UPI003D815E75